VFTLAILLAAVPADAQWLNYKTPGIPRTADGKPDLAAPSPLTADGKPDFSGVWRSDFEGNAGPAETPKLLSWAQALAKKRMDDLRRDSAEALCLPLGPSANAGVGKIVQTPSLLLMLYDGTYYREIFLDGRPLPNDPNPDWMGYSVGHWDGETLIVESNGFNDRTWLRGDGIPHTEQLRVTERIRRSDFGHLEVRMTYTDPGTLLAPWNVTAKYLRDDIQPLEYVCNENERDRVHLVGKASDLEGLKLDPDVLARYTGAWEYRSPANPEIRRLFVFTAASGRLELSVGKGSSGLTALSATVFATANGDRIEFFRDTGGTVSRVVVQLFDGDFSAERQK
jgi:hypothetical protein